MLADVSRFVEALRTTVGSFLFLASAIMCVVGLLNDSNMAFFGGPIVEGVMFVVCLVLLAINEGMQVALLGIKHVPIEDLHAFPRALRCKELIFGTIDSPKDLLARIFLGQSFMVVVCSFLLAQLTTFEYFPEQGNEAIDFLCTTFVRSGLCGVVMIVNLGQLFPSICAQAHPKQFLNIIGVLEVINLALVIESIGIVECTYAIVHVLRYVFFAGSTPTERGEAREGEEALPALKPVKTLVSSCIFVFYASLLLFNMFSGHSGLQEISSVLLVPLLLACYTVLFYCEGCKVAVLCTTALPREKVLRLGYRTDIYDFLVGPLQQQEQNQQDGGGEGEVEEDKGEGVAKFLLGRQMIVVPIGFLVAQITQFTSYREAQQHPWLFYAVVGLGQAGMIVTMQLVQLAPQVLASRLTRSFLALPGAYLLVRVSRLIERLGLTQAAFVMRSIVDSCCCFNNDKLFTQQQHEQAFTPLPVDYSKHDAAGGGDNPLLPQTSVTSRQRALSFATGDEDSTTKLVTVASL